MTLHKNQVGQAGAGINGGEFARKTQTEDAIVLTATATAELTPAGELLHAEARMRTIAYKDLLPVQRVSATAISRWVDTVQGLGKPVKTYEPTPLENGNVAVYINLNYGNSIPRAFDEVLNRVELDQEGTVVRFDITYMQSGGWQTINSEADLREYLTTKRVPHQPGE